MAQTNWAGNLTYGAKTFLTPGTVEEAQALHHAAERGVELRVFSDQSPLLGGNLCRGLVQSMDGNGTQRQIDGGCDIDTDEEQEQHNSNGS